MRRRRASTAAATAGVLGFVCVAFLLAVDSQTGGHSQYRRALRAVDRARRDLSINLGNGACLWTPAEPLPATDDVPRTLLASYPGSGKRFAWRVVEGLTGLAVGDDWLHWNPDADLSEAKHVATIKTSYPHQESRDWLMETPHGAATSWGTWHDEFLNATTIYIVRNPRDAIRAYQDTKKELAYAIDWDEAQSRRGQLYSRHARVESWDNWRNDLRQEIRFPDDPLDQRTRGSREIENWGKHIDYWMTAGTSDPDRPLCTVLTDCSPGVIVAFEKLYSSDDATSEAEFDRLVTAMERPGLPLIEEEARHCVVKVTKDKKVDFTNGWDDHNRDGKENEFEDKSWPTELLEEMVATLIRLIGVYSVTPYLADVNAQYLVTVLDGYLAEIQADLVAQG